MSMFDNFNIVEEIKNRCKGLGKEEYLKQLNWTLVSYKIDLENLNRLFIENIDRINLLNKHIKTNIKNIYSKQIEILDYIIKVLEKEIITTLGIDSIEDNNDKEINHSNFKMTIGAHREVILYSEQEQVPEDFIDEAYKDCDFVTISKDDAKNICSMIKDTLTKEGKSDIEVFGDKAISFERLYDRIDGLIYPKKNNNSKD